MQHDPVISTDTHGIWVRTGPTTQYGIRWDEIYAASASRIDCIISAEIIVALDFDFGEFIELNSSFRGFDEATTALNSPLAVDPSWLAAVAKSEPNSEPVVFWRS